MPEISPQGSLLHATIIHSLSPTNLQILQDTVIHISPKGTILSLTPNIPSASLPSHIAAQNLQHLPLKQLPSSPGHFLLPGFVDTHNHAPQWMQRGLGQGMHILDWLDGITFPNEARFGDGAYAEKIYPRLVEGMLRQGITTASYYGSLHGEATCILADTCHAKGQRALIGKCNMDRNSPDFYRDASAEKSLAVTKACISHIRALDPQGLLLRPVLTPRFAISCSNTLLSSLGALAASDPSLPIQTHFNEAGQEISATLSLFPEFSNEADLYDSFGLLNERSILAHCTIMNEYETNKIHELGCGVAHCPTANMTVGGGFMTAPIKQFLQRGIHVGLGTDSGGGYSSSMLDAMRHSMISSYARDAHHKPDAAQGGSNENDSQALSLEQVFYLSTVGGAKVVGFGDEIGNFAVGKQFDAIMVDMTNARNGVNAPIEDRDSVKTQFEKFIMTGDDRNIAEVYVRGRLVSWQVA